MPSTHSTRTHRKLPSYRLHNGSGQAFVELGGKFHYLGKYGTATSREKYDRLVAEWLAQGRPSQFRSSSAPQSLTVAEVCLAFWRYAKEYYANSSTACDDYRRTIRLLVSKYGSALVEEFGPCALKALRHELIERGQSRNYINEQVQQIRRIFKWAVSEELIEETIYRRLTTVEGLRKHRSAAAESSPVTSVSEQQIQLTLEQLTPTVADMVRVQLLTGMRPGEVCSLRPADIDRSGEIWIYRPQTHKTQHLGRERTVFLGPQAQQVLVRLLEREPEEYCFSPQESEARRLEERHRQRTTPLHYGNRPQAKRRQMQLSKLGACYTTESYRRAIHRACQRAKIPAWSPNQLRHAAATKIRQQFGIEAAQVVLGHANANVTQVYAERDYRAAKQVAKALG